MIAFFSSKITDVFAFSQAAKNRLKISGKPQPKIWTLLEWNMHRREIESESEYLY